MGKRVNLSQEQIKQLNDLAGFLKFQKTWPFERLIKSRDKVTALFTGNQFGKTAGVAFQYVMRILGIHPVVERNVSYMECECGKNWRMYEAPVKCSCGLVPQKHERGCKIFRFCSENLPGQSGQVEVGSTTTEVRNTQYPAIKKWLPPFLVKKDITFRSPTLTVMDVFGGDDIIIEFVGYNQSIQSTAGTQRLSVWYDEEPKKEFREEQIPRLLAENGDEIFSVTPANYITWMYDEIFENARVYYRTNAICEFLKSKGEEEAKNVKKGDSVKSITVIQAATDDNPTLKREAIEALFDNIDDAEVLAIRRYGIFKQVSGRIFKDFNANVHVLKSSEVFPNGIPKNWTHAKGIDYHPQTPWAFGCIALSPDNEAFIWAELNPSPERYTTDEIMEMVHEVAGGYRFVLNLIDPLSVAHSRVENGSSVTVLDDINRASFVYGDGYWSTWDTKGEKGRDEIRKRLRNSLKIGKPFSNRIRNDEGVEEILPTLWILDSCSLAIKSMKQWRWEEHAGVGSGMKEAKNKPEQRWSHINMVWEAIFKNSIFRPGVGISGGSHSIGGGHRKKKSYFKGGR